MKKQSSTPASKSHRKIALRSAFYLGMVTLMSNLNAMVDAILHPEIPYFDQEHLIVGGVTGLVTAVVFGLALLYMYYLEKARGRIETLEEFLRICAHCKKIHIPDSDPAEEESWQQIEQYIRDNSKFEFSHGICPKCAKELYPDFDRSGG